MNNRSVAPFVVPFRKPDHLVGRDKNIADLHERLKLGNVTLTPALTGQGGIGKTQLAALYVHTYPQAFPGGVFWLNCATPSSNALVASILKEYILCGRPIPACVDRCQSLAKGLRNQAGPNVRKKTYRPMVFGARETLCGLDLASIVKGPSSKSPILRQPCGLTLWRRQTDVDASAER